MLRKSYAIANDPILYFLHVKLKLNPIVISSLFVLGAFIMVPWAMDSGVWENIDYPLSKSYITWIGDIVVGMTVYFIIRYYNAIPKAFEYSYANKIIESNSTNLNAFKLECLKLYINNKYLYILFFSFMISIIIHLSYLYGDNLHGWTETAARATFSKLGYYHMLYFTIMLSIILNSFFCFYKTVVLFKKLENAVIKGRLKYNYVRLCKDYAGGLKQLGDLSLKFNNIIFTLGLYSIVLVFTIMDFQQITIPQILENSVAVVRNLHIWQIVEMLFPIPLFVILSPLLFYLHLLPLHRIMKYKKNEIVTEIISFDRELTDFSKSSISRLLRDPLSISKLIDNSKVFEFTQGLSDYPFNIKAISRVVGSTILPLLTLVKIIYAFT